jgi:hypothetical protein
MWNVAHSRRVPDPRDRPLQHVRLVVVEAQDEAAVDVYAVVAPRCRAACSRGCRRRSASLLPDLVQDAIENLARLGQRQLGVRLADDHRLADAIALLLDLGREVIDVIREVAGMVIEPADPIRPAGRGTGMAWTS